MHLISPRILSAVLLAVSLGPVRSQPLASLTIRSYRDLQQAVNQFGQALNPDAPTNTAQALSKSLGLPDDAAFDAQRPWQIAVWYEGVPAQPLVALKVPAADLDRFKEGLSPEGMLRKQGKDWKQMEGGWGLVSLRDTGTLTETEKAGLEQWQAAAVAPPSQAMQLTLHLNEPLRQQGLAMLALAKGFMRQTFATNQAFSAAGVNPKAMGDLMATYVELIETVVQGMQQLRLGVDVSSSMLTLEEVVTAKPDTELARWLQKQDGRITERELSLFDPKAMLFAAGHLSNSASQMAWLKKFTALGLQVQNIGPEDPVAKELDGLFDTMFPMNVALSAYWGDHLTFAGAYGFSKTTATNVYATMKNFLEKSMPGLVGPEKMYASATLQTNHHAIAQVPIDRFTLTVNTNSPLLNMPGQSAQLLSMWPNGAMVFDYAVSDDRLFFASPDLMPDLLRPPAQPRPKWAAALDATTILAGHVNLVTLIQRTAVSNPALPDAVKEKLARLEPAGTPIEFRVSLDNQWRASVRVPMKLFREARRISEAP